MDIKQTLAGFKQEIDREIEIYLDRAIEKAVKEDPLITDALRYVKKLVLAGGKRLRAAFMFYGYLATGGAKREQMLRAAVSIELIHLFLLIHDDVIDRDVTRHGIDTIAEYYRKKSAAMFLKIDNAHFGDSMAVIIGDMVGALGNQIIFESDFNCEDVHRAITHLQSIISRTVIGQVQDLYLEYKGSGTQQEILRMYEYKTARYTVEGPLHLGAILGGASKEQIEMFSAYALPIGTAFQIQDDILGVFGSEKKLGKPVGSDIEEGKITLLVARARESASNEDRVLIDSLLGRSGITIKEVKKFQQAIIRSGALDYAQQEAQKLIDQGKLALSEMPENEAKEFLLGIAQYMATREI